MKRANLSGATAPQVGYIPGARMPDITGYLKVLGRHRFLKVVFFYVGATDIQLCQAKVIK